MLERFRLAVSLCALLTAAVAQGPSSDLVAAFDFGPADDGAGARPARLAPPDGRPGPGLLVDASVAPVPLARSRSVATS